MSSADDAQRTASAGTKAEPFDLEARGRELGSSSSRIRSVTSSPDYEPSEVSERPPKSPENRLEPPDSGERIFQDSCFQPPCVIIVLKAISLTIPTVTHAVRRRVVSPRVVASPSAKRESDCWS